MVNKKFEFGLLYCFGLNIAFEVIQNLMEMKGKDYRLLVFRYIYVIAFGSYLALRGQKKIKKGYPMLFISGIVYITLVNYTSYEAKLFVYWTSTSAIAIMYIIPIFSFFMGWYNKKSEILEKNTVIKVFTLIGKASYNIFFVQILYYNYFDEVIREFCLNDTVHILVNIVICLIFGVIFYHLEMPITKRIIRKIDSLLYFL